MLKTVRGGIPVCVNVSLIDGLVMARSGFHHSINYRAVMMFGQAETLTDDAAKLKTLEAFTARRSEEHTSELQSLMRISYAVFCLQKKTKSHHTTHTHNTQ